MGKYLGLVVGTIIALLGVKGIISWWPDLLTVVKGTLPVIFLLAGVIAVIAGLSEIKDELGSPKK